MSALDVKACQFCRFSHTARNPENPLEKVLVCKWGPPTIVVLPAPQGVLVRVSWPPVPPEEWCHRFEGIEGSAANNGN